MTDRYWIAVDMDGTLLNSRGQISERTCAVLQKCLDQGHHVLPATGRALPLLPEKIKNKAKHKRISTLSPSLNNSNI